MVVKGNYQHHDHREEQTLCQMCGKFVQNEHECTEESLIVSLGQPHFISAYDSNDTLPLEDSGSQSNNDINIPEFYGPLRDYIPHEYHDFIPNSCLCSTYKDEARVEELYPGRFSTIIVSPYSDTVYDVGPLNANGERAKCEIIPTIFNVLCDQIGFEENFITHSRYSVRCARTAVRMKTLHTNKDSDFANADLPNIYLCSPYF